LAVRPVEATDEMIIAGGWHFGAALKQLPQDDVHDKAAQECWRDMQAAFHPSQLETKL
jgi:hypothetical protein